MKKLKKFNVYWLDDTVDLVEGYDVFDACRRAGFTASDLAVMDYFQEITNGSISDSHVL